MNRTTSLGRNGRFRDRREGGWLLTKRLRRYRKAERALVLGIPRGGVVTAAEVARELDLPLDVVISRKLRAASNPDFTLGAVAEGTEPYVNDPILTEKEGGAVYLAREAERERAEIDRCQQLFRGGRPLALAPATTAILVDDGVATGSTVIAAIRALRTQPLERLVLAVPVVPRETLWRLKPLVDELVVLTAPGLFWAIAGFYDDFKQVSDEGACELLEQARSRRASSQPPAARPSARRPQRGTH